MVNDWTVLLRVRSSIVANGGSFILCADNNILGVRVNEERVDGEEIGDEKSGRWLGVGRGEEKSNVKTWRRSSR